MTNQTRGAAVAQLMRDLGVNRSRLSERAGVDMKTLARALDGEATVRSGTYDRLEVALRDMAAEQPTDAPKVSAVTYRFEDGSGINLTVQGPAEDMADLGEQFAQMVAKAIAAQPQPQD